MKTFQYQTIGGAIVIKYAIKYLQDKRDSKEWKIIFQEKQYYWKEKYNEVIEIKKIQQL